MDAERGRRSEGFGARDAEHGMRSKGCGVGDAEEGMRKKGCGARCPPLRPSPHRLGQERRGRPPGSKAEGWGFESLAPRIKRGGGASSSGAAVGTRVLPLGMLRLAPGARARARKLDRHLHLRRRLSVGLALGERRTLDRVGKGTFGYAPGGRIRPVPLERQPLLHPGELGGGAGASGRVAALVNPFEGGGGGRGKGCREPGRHHMHI